MFNTFLINMPETNIYQLASLNIYNTLVAFFAREAQINPLNPALGLISPGPPQEIRVIAGYLKVYPTLNSLFLYSVLSLHMDKYAYKCTLSFSK